MSNAVAIWLVILIGVLLAADYLLFDQANTIFAVRAFLDVIATLAFWR